MKFKFKYLQISNSNKSGKLSGQSTLSEDDSGNDKDITKTSVGPQISNTRLVSDEFSSFLLSEATILE